MRHGYFGKKLSRNTNERKRLLMVLAREVLNRGSIQTSIAKAKAVQPMVEKLITLAKHGNGRQIGKVLGDKETTDLLLFWAKNRFANRTSGFTRIVRLGRQVGDGTEAVLFSFVDARPADIEKPPQVKTEKRAEKKVVKTVKVTRRKVVKKTSVKKVTKKAKK